MNIPKPTKYPVAAADAARWRGDGRYIFTRKYDGVFATTGVVCGAHLLICEVMQPKSGGKFTKSDWYQFNRLYHLEVVPTFYVAHSVAAVDGASILHRPALERWNLLTSLFKGGAQRDEHGDRIVLAESGAGGDFFNAVVADGGEGVCAVPVEAPWGIIYAAKPLMELYPRVTSKNIAMGTVEIVDANTFEPLGSVPCRAHFDMVNVGDIVEVHCIEKHRSGRLREARFVAVRNDKKCPV